MVLILLIIRFCTVSSEFGLLCFKVFPRTLFWWGKILFHLTSYSSSPRETRSWKIRFTELLPKDSLVSYTSLYKNHPQWTSSSYINTNHENALCKDALTSPQANMVQPIPDGGSFFPGDSSFCRVVFKRIEELVSNCMGERVNGQGCNDENFCRVL